MRVIEYESVMVKRIGCGYFGTTVEAGYKRCGYFGTTVQAGYKRRLGTYPRFAFAWSAAEGQMEEVTVCTGASA